MGFWDGDLADLEAIGIRFDPMLEAALEGEAEYVLHAHRLLSPFSTPEYQEYLEDQDGQPVWVIEKIKVLNPRGYIPLGGGTLGSIASLVTDYWGTDWTDYPSVVGLLENEDRYTLSCYYEWNMHRSEQPTPYRFWLCFPYDEAVYQALSRACDERLQDAYVYDVDQVTTFEFSDDYWVDTCSVWLYEHEPDLLADQERAYIREWEEHELIAWDKETFADRKEQALKAYERLAEVGLQPSPYPKERDSWGFPGFSLKPMEHYLAAEPTALAIWRTLMAQREYAKSRLSRAYFSGDTTWDRIHEEYT